MRGTRRSPRPTSTASSAKAICPPFLARYVYACPWPLDVDKLQACARLFEGEHDFLSFAATDPDLAQREALDRSEEPGRHDGASRRIASARLAKRSRTSLLLGWEAAAERGRRAARLSRPRQRLSAPHGAQPGGNHAGCGPRTSRALEEIPANSRCAHRSAAGPTAPARGLFLHSVEYDETGLHQ